ncbi:hypothetical protein HUW51_15675 [Adhaeribacter swui]|uniref:Uncharacterized protein n=1 Tax=Adhaeribacter swui TaxID=2086471 RepID=A0A7G7GAA6_9BACT|nr:hypothetical protein [Adhaeribacter swui]QNF34090.1 hypothetical protein HUW51_15675 [Adhaeribacter swui]
MERKLMLGFCFKSDEQSFKAIQPGIGLFHGILSFEEFFIKIDVFLIWLTIARITGDICLYPPLGTLLSELLAVKTRIGM